MIAKILRFLTIATARIQPLSPSRSRTRIVCWQTEFHF